MDINNILTKIENYKTATAQKAEQERIAAEHHRQRLLDQIRVMKPNIDNLVKVANAVREAYVDNLQGNSVRLSYENENFMADAWTHKVGFVTYKGSVPYYKACSYPKIIGVGFEGGGCCGDYDFFTDGLVICDRNRDNGHDREASTEHLEKFIEKFPEFEKAFYDYIAKKTECEPPIKNEYYIEVSRYDGEKVLESRWFNSVAEAEDWWKDIHYFTSGDYIGKLLAAKSIDGRTICGDDDNYDVKFVKYLQ